MKRFDVGGADLEYTVQGEGEPLLLIHGVLLADAFSPLLAEPRLAGRHRLISYHRRGFAGSARAIAPLTMAEQAADARALLRHLGISHAHVAGHSYGAAIALQLALDAPDEVRSLAVLEPPLFDSIPSGPLFWEGFAAIRTIYESGDPAGAVDAFCVAVAGPDYRPMIDTVLPPGAFDLAVADVDTFFQVEAEALRPWHFGLEEASRLGKPVLTVSGGQTAPFFRESHEILKKWIPDAEELMLPTANHALQMMDPGTIAAGLAGFFARHPLPVT